MKTIRQRLNTIITLITLLKLSTLSQQTLKERLKKNSKKLQYDSHEDFAADFKKYKVSMNKDTGVFSYEATGSIDQDAKTMTFDEGISVTNSFFFSFGENRISPNTYHYELKDDMLYITIDGKAKKNNLPVHYELHFKRKRKHYSKEPVPIEGKWQAIDFRPALERSLAYKDFKMMIRLSNLSILKHGKI